MFPRAPQPAAAHQWLPSSCTSMRPFLYMGQRIQGAGFVCFFVRKAGYAVGAVVASFASHRPARPQRPV